MNFKSLAFDDIARNVSNGFNRLIHLYGSFLPSDRILACEVVHDLVDLGGKRYPPANIYRVFVQPGRVTLSILVIAERSSVFWVLT
jgi:hypothetical protein